MCPPQRFGVWIFKEGNSRIVNHPRRVLVLNHFAVPMGASGGTRHTELFSRLDGWSHLIVNASTSIHGDTQIVMEPGFRTVWAVPFRTNGIRRILNWATYATSAAFHGLSGRRPDIVYASSPHLLAGLAGWAIAQRWRAPFILEVRDLWPRVLVEMGQLTEDSQIYVSLTALEEFLYARAERIVVMSRGIEAELVGRGVPATKLVYIPNGADPQDFEVGLPRDELRQRYGFTRFTCVYLGAHGPANGLTLLLDAAESISDLDLDIVLVGSGIEKNRLLGEASVRGLDNVRFMDAVPKSEVPAILAAADAGLHVLADVPLFKYGISPNKVFDYMASGRPLVTNVPGEIGDLVLRAGGGIVTQPSEIASGLRQLCELSPEELMRMGRSGAQFMLAEHSRTAMALRLQQLLDASF